jgi:hypothetical protein
VEGLTSEVVGLISVAGLISEEGAELPQSPLTLGPAQTAWNAGRKQFSGILNIDCDPW